MDQLGFSLYLITDRAAAPRPPADVVEECLAAGLRAVQLREKDLEARDLLALADTLREATRRHGARLIVNDRADVALAAAADGVQRTHASLPVAALREITPAGFLVGASVHSEAEAREADRAGRGLHRLRAGLRHRRPSGATARRRVWPRSRRWPARWTARSSPWAGSRPSACAEVLAAGAAGVAVIGAIYAAARPADATKAFLDALGRA